MREKTAQLKLDFERIAESDYLHWRTEFANRLTADSSCGGMARKVAEYAVNCQLHPGKCNPDGR